MKISKLKLRRLYNLNFITFLENELPEIDDFQEFWTINLLGVTESAFNFPSENLK